MCGNPLNWIIGNNEGKKPLSKALFVSLHSTLSTTTRPKQNALCGEEYNGTERHVVVVVEGGGGGPVERVPVLRSAAAPSRCIQSHKKHAASPLAAGIGTERFLLRLLERTEHLVATDHGPRRHFSNAHSRETERVGSEVFRAGELGEQARAEKE